ncbi:DMT family transporter [Actomonas aquatica]|uniref:DMT family transporter n=1 Tax=Actomonas aquatica TaxID=2866162 RepID=A0ABZ1CC41_9BACT|nr:DMT family transporter [Opitutus sp. WL0086]WRQ88823.1 DMT family transporter [Opitutus sp. WL0086]
MVSVMDPEYGAKRRSRWQLLALVAVCAVLWGSAFPGIKLVFDHWAAQGIEADFATRSLFAGVRFTVAGLGLLLFARAPLREWAETPRYWILAMAAAQTVGQYVCFYMGLSLSSGALASLLVSSGSFWWVLLAPPFLGTPRLTRRQWLVLAAGALGVTMAVYSPGVGEGSPRLGGGLILAASFFGALGLLAFQRVKRTMGARAGTGYSLFLGGVVLLALGWPAVQAGGLAWFDAYVWAWTAWLAFVSAAAFALWNHLSTLFPAPELATYRFLIPLAGVFESLLLLDGERLTVGMVAGGVVVLAAMSRIAVRKAG